MDERGGLLRRSLSEVVSSVPPPTLPPTSSLCGLLPDRRLQEFIRQIPNGDDDDARGSGGRPPGPPNHHNNNGRRRRRSSSQHEPAGEGEQLESEALGILESRRSSRCRGVVVVLLLLLSLRFWSTFLNCSLAENQQNLYLLGAGSGRCRGHGRWQGVHVRNATNFLRRPVVEAGVSDNVLNRKWPLQYSSDRARQNRSFF